MLNKSLSVILIIAIIGTIGAIVYLTTTPKVGETFTEFYILGPGGKAENYPEQLSIGETSNVTVGIVNHEQKQVSYQVKVLIDSEENGEAGSILLGDGEKWEGEMALIPKVPGDNQKVEFLLFKGDETVIPANSLHLWINVKG